MNRLGVWDPWRGSNSGLSDIFEDDWGWSDNSGNEIDMFEEDGQLVIKVRAPGFKKSDLDVTVKGNVLTISGNISAEVEKENKNRKYIRREIRIKSFTRRIELPGGIKADDIKADFTDGVLTLTMPESEESVPRRITF